MARLSRGDVVRVKSAGTKSASHGKLGKVMGIHPGDLYTVFVVGVCPAAYASGSHEHLHEEELELVYDKEDEAAPAREFFKAYREASRAAHEAAHEASMEASMKASYEDFRKKADREASWPLRFFVGTMLAIFAMTSVLLIFPFASDIVQAGAEASAKAGAEASAKAGALVWVLVLTIIFCCLGASILEEGEFEINSLGRAMLVLFLPLILLGVFLVIYLYGPVPMSSSAVGVLVSIVSVVSVALFCVMIHVMSQPRFIGRCSK